jgi:hypothetical protein
VGNYPGVTVERRVATMSLGPGQDADLVDIPGTYSIVGRSAEEQIAIRELTGLGGGRRPDLVVLCVDATNLVRNLYLALQLQELGVNLVVALTMMDEARGILPEPHKLGAVLAVLHRPRRRPQRRGGARPGRADAGPPRHPRRRPALALDPVADCCVGPWTGCGPRRPEGWPKDDALALWALMSVTETDELQGVPQAVQERRCSSAGPTGEGGR